MAEASRPLVFLVETVEYVLRGLGRKKTETAELFERNGYMRNADTRIDSIFVERATFEARFNGGKQP